MKIIPFIDLILSVYTLVCKSNKNFIKIGSALSIIKSVFNCFFQEQKKNRICNILSKTVIDILNKIY